MRHIPAPAVHRKRASSRFRGRRPPPPSMFPCSSSLLPPLPLLHLSEQHIQLLEALLPELPIPLQPRMHLDQRGGLQPARPALRVLTLGDEAGPLEDLEMLRDGWLAEGKRPCQFHNRGFSGGQAGQNCPSRRIGEGRE